jgi:hypothetical protein
MTISLTISLGKDLEMDLGTGLGMDLGMSYEEKMVRLNEWVTNRGWFDLD